MSVYTGYDKPLLPYLKSCISKAENIRFIVSFIMEGGINLIIKELKQASDRGANIQILTSNYMGITEPNALYILYNELGQNIRLFSNTSISFHPKAYLFDYGKNKSEIIIGSSNLSKSALTSGVEWNFKFDNTHHFDKDYELFLSEFNELYEKSSFNLTIEWLRKYEKTYQKTSFYRESDKININEETETLQAGLFPINFQIPALYELSKTREEGYDKAMVIAATGLGKTYLAAFDTLNFKKILFVAHREEILLQAKKSFNKIHHEKKTGLFLRKQKDREKDIIFATVQTLAKSRYLNDRYFSPESFDYLIIDEFHHSAAKSYLKILNYFKPEFLLGITATPDRMDNKDVYKFCDYNVAYQCDFKTAINQEWLSPFRYYGVYDKEVNYNEIPLRNGKYSIDELEKYFLLDKRAKLILDKYKEFDLKKTVGFCASIKHAEYMAEYFRKDKIKASVITSDTVNRQEIINCFENGKIKVLFTVDIFNEGVDIPQIDGVLFLRPTESYTIFIQQLGRGLRKTENKEFLTLLDFVGNYKGAYLKPLFLSGIFSPKGINKEINLKTIDELDFPKDCKINFDLKLVDLFKEMSKNKIPINELLKEEYFKIKKDLGYKPNIMDVFTESNYPVKMYLQTFGSWLNFKEVINELDEHEKEWANGLIGRFLKELEKTSMTKSYKVPVLLTFVKTGELKTVVKIDDVIYNFKEFYLQNKRYLIDMQDKTNKNWQEWNFDRLKKFVLSNPLHFLSSGQSKSFFNLDSEKGIFTLNEEIADYLQNSPGIKPYLKEAFIDRVNYRLKNYFKRKYLED